MRTDLYLDAVKEMGITGRIAMLDKVSLADSTLEAADPEKYARSFPVHSLA